MTCSKIVLIAIFGIVLSSSVVLSLRRNLGDASPEDGRSKEKGFEPEGIDKRFFGAFHGYDGRKNKEDKDKDKRFFGAFHGYDDRRNKEGKDKEKDKRIFAAAAGFGRNRKVKDKDSDEKGGDGWGWKRGDDLTTLLYRNFDNDNVNAMATLLDDRNNGNQDRGIYSIGVLPGKSKDHGLSTLGFKRDDKGNLLSQLASWLYGATEGGNSNPLQSFKRKDDGENVWNGS